MRKEILKGAQSYRKVKEGNFYCVDKSMMIYEFLKKPADVTLITRPRRFGKTFNMSMMAEFFDITKDSKDIFKDTKIMETEYSHEMNQWPVISLSFSGAKRTEKEITEKIRQELFREYERHRQYLNELESGWKRKYDSMYETLLDNDAGLDSLTSAIQVLARVLFSLYGKKVMVFIDEYDTPYIEAELYASHNCLNNPDLKSNIASMYQAILKDCADSVQYAMVTGIQRIVKENIFSGLNNPKISTVMDDQYSEYFGFTEKETKEMLEYYGKDLNDEVKAMYDGYRFGNREIYNPWSITNYCSEEGDHLDTYWVNTSSNGLIKEAIRHSEPSFRTSYEKLIETGEIAVSVNFESSFFEDSSNDTLWGLFVNSGYLTVKEVISKRRGLNRCKLVIPNGEVETAFVSFTEACLKVRKNLFMEMIDALENGDIEVFFDLYSEMLKTPSYLDLTSENSYHNFLLGITTGLKNDYDILSNRENGDGRPDILLHAKKAMLPSYVIELKHTKDDKADLNSEAAEAFKQIKDEDYTHGLTGTVYLVGLGHKGKHVQMKYEVAEQ